MRDGIGFLVRSRQKTNMCLTLIYGDFILENIFAEKVQLFLSSLGSQTEKIRIMPVVFNVKFEQTFFPLKI